VFGTLQHSRSFIATKCLQKVLKQVAEKTSSSVSISLIFYVKSKRKPLIFAISSLTGHVTLRLLRLKMAR
jgi:hypothetical protein